MKENCKIYYKIVIGFFITMCIFLFISFIVLTHYLDICRIPQFILCLQIFIISKTEYIKEKRSEFKTVRFIKSFQVSDVEVTVYYIECEGGNEKDQ